jgi:glucose-6-phosphate dehydrogenase assembly protein OpcA
LEERAYVVDLAWLRSTPWRERVAATFDPARLRRELGAISSVTVRHRPDSVVTGLLFCGWLASRLGWEPGNVMTHDGGLYGRCHGRRQDVELKLEPDPTMSAPGLAGVTIQTALVVAQAMLR